MARWQSCNVLQVGKDGRQLWQFSAGGDKFKLDRAETRLPTEPLPARLIARDWQTLFQPRLNIAWLPTDQVFVRALQLPSAEPAELHSMIELQLEKISPLPVAQIVWAYELLPQRAGDLQTVIVIVAARSVVEEFLGRIEGQGYLADRLELPVLDLLAATQFQGDGVWIYPGLGTEQDHALVAWWYGGVLQNLSLLHLPPSERRAALLREQLTQITWAGELEGWLTAAPTWRLVADTASADSWLLEFLQEESVQIIPPPAPADLASLTARRVAANGATTNLLPPEFSARYKQQFVDRLWMRGLGGALAVYLLAIAAYFGWAQFDQMRLDGVNEEITRLGSAYTNALRLKEQVKVLQDQLDLQYAALETYKAIAELLPPELTLDSINFDLRGRKVTIAGYGSEADMSKVQDFNASLAGVTAKDQPLFARVSAPSTGQRPGNQISWFFPCELKRGESE